MKVLQMILVGVAVTVTGAQAQSPRSSDRDALIGAWHLVRIDVPGADGKVAASANRPEGMLIYTRDGNMSVQLMYPKSANAPDNEYVLGGYEASFGSYDVNQAKHLVTHHVQGSVTRNLLVGKDLPRVYQLTADGHLIIRSANPREHWSVTWQHFEAKEKPVVASLQ